MNLLSQILVESKKFLAFLLGIAWKAGITLASLIAIFTIAAWFVPHYPDASNFIGRLFVIFGSACLLGIPIIHGVPAYEKNEAEMIIDWSILAIVMQAIFFGNHLYVAVGAIGFMTGVVLMVVLKKIFYPAVKYIVREFLWLSYLGLTPEFFGFKLRKKPDQANR